MSFLFLLTKTGPFSSKEEKAGQLSHAYSAPRPKGKDREHMTKFTKLHTRGNWM